MPELPEVQTIVTDLQASLPGSRIGQVLVLRADIVDPAGFDLRQHLTGRSIASVTRRGKRIIFQLDDANRFYIHLGMTGRLTVGALDAPRLKHTHLVLRFDKSEIHFTDPRRFGGLWWVGPSEADQGMGPEPLETSPAQLAGRLSKTHRPIKNALLDQSVIAGLGNIYVDESLFTAKIHPLTLADQLTKAQIAALNRSIKSTLQKALRHKGSTLRDYRNANGESGNFQKLHRVYDRKGEPCANCGAPILRIVLGGRSTHFCGKCQKR